jgi:hypothetical protein
LAVASRSERQGCWFEPHHCFDRSISLSRYAHDKKLDRQLPPKSDSWKKASKKKNTKRWCKGVVGREHVPQLRIDHYWSVRFKRCGLRKDLFYWTESYSNGEQWFCFHNKTCTVCGKIFVHGLRKEECPDYIERFGKES